MKDAHRFGCVISFSPLGGNLTMEQHEQVRFDLLAAQHLQALKLQGKRGMSINGYRCSLGCTLHKRLDLPRNAFCLNGWQPMPGTRELDYPLRPESFRHCGRDVGITFAP